MLFAWVKVANSPGRPGSCRPARGVNRSAWLPESISTPLRFGHGRERRVGNSQTEDSRCIVLGNGAEVARQLELKADQASDVDVYVPSWLR